MKIIIFIALSGFVFLGCNPGNDDQDPQCVSLLNRIEFPAMSNGSKITFEYNTDKALVRTLYYSDAVTISRADTFYYSGATLIRSSYSLNGINFTTPYAYTEWDHVNNKLVASRYYVKQGTNYPLYSNSTYETNNSGMVTVVNQFLSGNLQKNRFEYDAQMNLRKVYIQFGSGAETLYDEYFDYDSLPNPFYKLPFEFDYDLYLYGADRLSKNNYRRHIRGSNNETFQFTYDADKINTIIEASNPFPALTVRKFIWECR